jgi:hypothetical protein
MCTWPSMSPGTAVRPLRSMTLVFVPAASARPPTDTKRPFLIDTVLTTVLAAFIVWMRPFVRTSV